MFMLCDQLQFLSFMRWHACAQQSATRGFEARTKLCYADFTIVQYEYVYLSHDNMSSSCCACFVFRAITVGKDYPHPDGIGYVRRKWKGALRDPKNCRLIEETSSDAARENERIIRKAVGRGRYVSVVADSVLISNRAGFGSPLLVVVHCLVVSTGTDQALIFLTSPSH